MSEGPYTDKKGRTRWRENDRLAERLKELYDLLVVGGYEESHAARYPKLAYVISRHPEPVADLHRAGRLRELPGVGATVEEILAELIDTGTCAKMTTPNAESHYDPPPRTVLELTALPGLGAKTVRRLYVEYGIDSRAGLRDALESGALADFKGIGPKLRTAVLEGP